MSKLPTDGMVHTLKHDREEGLDIAVRMPYRDVVSNQPAYVQLWQSDDATGDPYEMVELSPGQLDELVRWWGEHRDLHQ